MFVPKSRFETKTCYSDREIAKYINVYRKTIDIEDSDSKSPGETTALLGFLFVAMKSVSIPVDRDNHSPACPGGNTGSHDHTASLTHTDNSPAVNAGDGGVIRPQDAAISCGQLCAFSLCQRQRRGIHREHTILR